MFRRVAFLVVILINTITTRSQTINDIINRLDNAKLVNPYEKKALLKELKSMKLYQEMDLDGNVSSYEKEVIDQPHYPLQVLMMLKMFSTTGTSSMFGFSPAEIEIKKGQEEKIIRELKTYTNKLKAAKLISEITAAELYQHINGLKLRSEYEVTEEATTKTEKEYFLTLPMYKPFADSLLSRELINEKDYNEIIQKISKSEFRSYDEPLNYLKNFIVIDLEKYKGEPKDYLETAYKETSKVFPDLGFDSLSFTLIEDRKEWSKDLIQVDMIVSLKRDNTWYRYRSYFDAITKNKKSEFRLVLPENYHQVFNKILADQLSPYRLHKMNLRKNSLGIIALTKEQFEGLVWSYSGMSDGGYINLSYENFSNKITQTKLFEAIGFYDSIDLLSHLTRQEKDSCIKEAMAKEINYFSHILSSFKNLVFEIDLEYGVNDGQYKKITENIALISKGHFSPSNIIDTYNYEKGKRFDYGFVLNGVLYKTQLYQEDDWLDPGFWELIEKAVSEQDKNGKFYYLHPADGMRQIYLTTRQAEILRQKKMIELEEADVEN